MHELQVRSAVDDLNGPAKHGLPGAQKDMRVIVLIKRDGFSCDIPVRTWRDILRCDACAAQLTGGDQQPAIVRIADQLEAGAWIGHVCHHL